MWVYSFGKGRGGCARARSVWAFVFEKFAFILTVGLSFFVFYMMLSFVRIARFVLLLCVDKINFSLASLREFKKQL